MNTTIKAIETHYKGYRFRSRLEARWAVGMDAVGVEWQYEPEGFELSSGGYLPDFYLPKQNRWLEIKPVAVPAHGIYLAGKAELNREKLDKHGHFITGPEIIRAHDDTREAWDVLDDCIGAIRRSNCLFAYIDKSDCHGTLVEIGYAKALGLNVVVAFHESIGDDEFESHGGHGDSRAFEMWFVRQISNRSFVGCMSYQEAFSRAFPLTIDERKCAELSRAGSEVYLCGGSFDKAIDATVFLNGRAMCRSCGVHHALNISHTRIKDFLEAARSARFEHGEQG